MPDNKPNPNDRYLAVPGSIVIVDDGDDDDKGKKPKPKPEPEPDKSGRRTFAKDYHDA